MHHKLKLAMVKCCRRTRHLTVFKIMLLLLMRSILRPLYPPWLCRYNRDDFVRLVELVKKLGKTKLSCYRAVGAASVALVQLQICLPTDTSKTKLDLQQPSAVQQPPCPGSATG